MFAVDPNSNPPALLWQQVLLFGFPGPINKAASSVYVGDALGNFYGVLYGGRHKRSWRHQNFRPATGGEISPGLSGFYSSWDRLLVRQSGLRSSSGRQQCRYL